MKLLFRNSIFFSAILSLLFSCNKEDSSWYVFEIKKSNVTGIKFRNQLKNTPELNILTYLYYYNGAGIGVGDFNNDGWEDLYFVANQNKNQLYINQKNLQFKEITPALLEDTQGWSTGVAVIDINNDGWQDIYLCKVGNYKNLKGENKLFINKGLDGSGNPIFSEEAKKYNLDIASFATQSAFLDYDKDGDLDMFLLNHSVHPNRTYGRGSKRKLIDTLSGDRLYRNDQGVFNDVSKDAKIYQGKIGYGLGVAIGDLNSDGYPDIYVGNDFFENDYIYINQKDGTFKEIISGDENNIGHTSHFSMGIDIADINNDELSDILSLDMLPEKLTTYKSSGVEYGYTVYNQYLKNGYRPQYMQNALQLNRGNGNFSELAFYAGIAATEWSWAPLIADLNNDGYKDVFISNGIKGATNDMDFISFIANDNIQKRINKGMEYKDLALIDELPDKKTTNYFYKNNGDLTFEDVSTSWIKNKDSYSNGAIFSDLDNDGDLDLITNNIEEEAYVYENKTNKLSTNNYIKIKLRGTKENIDAIGAKIMMYANGQVQTSEYYRTRGYLSSVSSVIHFGLHENKSVDSIIVRWPEGNQTVHRNLMVNNLNVLERTKQVNSIKTKQGNLNLVLNDSSFIKYKHKDFETKDFTVEPLAPYAVSNEGPHLSVRDVNQDGMDDVFIPGGRFMPSVLFLQNKNGSFKQSAQPYLEKDAKYEDIAQCFLDVDGDKDLDLIIISGGNEGLTEYEGGPRFYKNEAGTYVKQDAGFNGLKMNGSVVRAADVDLDGDIDVMIGVNASTANFGKTPRNYLFINDGSGNYKDMTDQFAPDLNKLGLVYDARFKDMDGDSDLDLVLAGHFMPITILSNNGDGYFAKSEIPELNRSNGWWNCIQVLDMDNDGDLDMLAGNWGLNTRLSASEKEPIQLYRNDFDENGKVDPLVTYFYKGKETPIATKDELSKQIPELNKKFLSYTDFAEASVNDYFPGQKLKEAHKKKVFILTTTYFENKGNFNFEAKNLPWQAQMSSVHDILFDDINNDGYPDVILAGNTYEISTQLGRLDGSYGSLFLNDTKGNFKSMDQKDFKIKGATRSIQKIMIKDQEYFLFGVNNDSLQIAKKSKN